ncbi:MAG TPA: N-acetylglucosamine-6-phosphate deacetylase, partial [Microbacterium sp.]|nr:N-acetylglucosamine-6-phosphate deacetylase [Microbacterium sp.]
MPVIAAGRVATATAVHCPGWIETDARGSVVAVGSGRPPRPADIAYDDGIVVPGFVDMHVHGGGGGDYTDLDEESVRRAREVHFAHGTTTSMASLVTADPQRLRAQVDLLTRLV